MKNQYPKLLKLLEARRAGQTNIIATTQSGGKALTRSEQKKKNILENADFKAVPQASNNDKKSSLYDDPVPGTSTGGTTKPPLLKAYKKTTQKNIVSKTLFLFIYWLLITFNCPISVITMFQDDCTQLLEQQQADTALTTNNCSV